MENGELKIENEEVGGSGCGGRGRAGAEPRPLTACGRKACEQRIGEYRKKNRPSTQQVRGKIEKSAETAANCKSEIIRKNLNKPCQCSENSITDFLRPVFLLPCKGKRGMMGLTAVKGTGKLRI